MLTQLFPKCHSGYTASHAAHRPVPATGKFSAKGLPRMFSRRKRTWSYQATRRAFHRFLLERGAITATTRAGRFRSMEFLSEHVGTVAARGSVCGGRRTVRRLELPPRAIDWDLVKRLLNSIYRQQSRSARSSILHLMAHYGLRPSAIASLTIDAIDWWARTLRVEQRKTRSALLLPLTDHTVSLLRNYLRRGRPHTTHSGCSFGHERRRVRSRTIPSEMCSRRSARQGGLALEGHSAYGLRHGFAMRLLDRGIGVRAIGDLLGHRTLESTCVFTCVCKLTPCVRLRSRSRDSRGEPSGGSIERQRSLGRKYDVEERVVASLCRFLSDIRAEDLDLSRFEAWCSTFSGLGANVRRNRQRIVRNLCLYRRRTESGCFVPDLNRFPRSVHMKHRGSLKLRTSQKCWPPHVS